MTLDELTDRIEEAMTERAREGTRSSIREHAEYFAKAVFPYIDQGPTGEAAEFTPSPPHQKPR